MEGSFEFVLSQDQPSTQSFVLVKSASSKHSPKIIASDETLLAIHMKIKAHLKNERPLSRIELYKLQAILKRMRCSSPRDQRAAQLARDILKCINGRTSQKEVQTLKRNLSNVTSSSSGSTSDDSEEKQHMFREGSRAMLVSTDYDARQQLFAARPETYAPMSQQTESQQDLAKMSVSTDSDATQQLFAARLETYAPMSQQTESQQDLAAMSVSTDSDARQQLFDARPEIYAPMSQQTESQQDLATMSVSTDSLPDARQQLFGGRSDNLKYTFTAPILHQTESNLRMKASTASNLFSSQTVDGEEELSYVKEVTLSKKPKTSDSATNRTLSEIFLKRLAGSQNDDVDSDEDIPLQQKDLPAPFTVPTLLGKGEKSSVPLQSNVLNLKFADVQFGSDSISIPLELLSNLNFGSSGVQQGANCNCTSKSYISDNNVLSSTRTESTHERDTLTVPSYLIQENSVPDIEATSNRNNLPKSPFKPVNKNPSQTGYALYTNKDFSFKKNSESASFHQEFPYPRTTSADKHGEKVSRVTTSKKHSDILSISDFSTNLEITDTGKPNWNKEVPVLPGTLLTVDKKNLLADESCIEDTQCTPRKTNVTNVNGENFELVPEAKHKNMDSETSDVEGGRLIQTEDSMDICKSFTEEQDLEMTDAERGYLEMVANTTESETNNFIFDPNVISKVLSQTEDNEGDEGSYEFELNTDNCTGDVIEATPFDDLGKKAFNTKIKTLLPEKSENYISTNNLSIISQIPVNNQYNNRVPQSVKVEPRDQRHTLFKPYKKWPRSNSFQEMYNRNYQRKYPRTTSQRSEINTGGNGRDIGENLTQSQSLADFTSENKKAISHDLGDRSSLNQLTNMSVCNTLPPLPNTISETQSNTLINQERTHSENMVLIDGAYPQTTEEMDIAQAEPEEESFEEKSRKLTEELTRKRNKYKDAWNEKPVTEKVSLKYVKKFGVNIYEDPVNSLMNIGYKVNVNNFHFPRLTMKEMNEKLKKSHEKVTLFNEALTKMIDTQISSSTEEGYQFKVPRNAAESDSSDEDEQTKKKRVLDEIRIMARLETKKFLEDMEKERKEEIRLGKGDDDEETEPEKLSEKEETRRLVELLRKAEDCSWLK